tara:strand:- start:19389 stop:19910 length:522 start_codon:yes stop_codon:yes gene_type:complete
MIRILTVLCCVLVLLGCKNNDDDAPTNGFSINGTTYATGFAYTTEGNGANKSILIFSSADRTQPTYTESRGRFDLRFSETLIPGAYNSGTGAFGETYEFSEGIRVEEGSFVSMGTSLAFSTSGSGGFQSASATVNSVTLNTNDQVTQIDIDYTINFDDKTIRGNYSGPVRISF